MLPLGGHYACQCVLFLVPGLVGEALGTEPFLSSPSSEQELEGGQPVWIQ